MEDKEKIDEVRTRYEREFDNLEFIINQLSEKRIYGIEGNRSKSDGALETIIEKLRTELYSLIKKIVLQEDSESEQLKKMFKKVNTEG